MSGKRLLDAAAVLKASRAVASKHLTFRRHQLDAYSRTSSLAKAIQNQTYRFTLTLRAASALAARFNGPGPGYSTQAAQPNASSQEDSVPSSSAVAGSPKQTDKKQGLEQDHFYRKSEENTTAKPLQSDELGVKQEEAKQDPLPDGSILEAGATSGTSGGGVDSEPNVSSKSTPTDQRSHDLTSVQAKRLQRESEKQIPSQAAGPPLASPSYTAIPQVSDEKTQEHELGAEQGQDVFYSASTSTGKVLSGLPRVKLPKATEDTQESDPRVPDGQINQDVFYTSTPNKGGAAMPSVQAIPEQDEVSEDMYSDIFQSPKVARMMKGQSRYGQRSKGLDTEGTKVVPSEKNKAADERDYVSFSERDGLQSTGETREERENKTGDQPEQEFDEKDARELAQDMAKDADNLSMPSRRLQKT